MIDKVIELLKQHDIESISGMDATFLYGESDNSPMHIGGLIIIEGSLEFEDFKKIIESRIHQVARMRQRLVYVPMSIDYPYWVDDPDFNIDMHLQHIALPKPSNWEQLRKLTSRVFSEPLDRTRPLWTFTFIEGLDEVSQVPKGSVGILTKMHHVAIDGMGGAELMGLMFDFSPVPMPLKDPKPYRPKPLPSMMSLMMKSGLTFAESPLKLPSLMTDILKASFKSGALSRIKYAQLPSASGFTAPRTPLNKTISPLRKWGTAILSLDRVKALKNKAGVTVNDVMLGICSGALRRYLLEKGKLPHKSLVALVPISTRANGDDSDSNGNAIAQMLVQIATQIEDPVERLETIHDNTVQGKTYHNAMGAKTLTEIASAVPFGVANQAARIYNRYNLSKLHNPIFNVTITNVPGPPFPLYMNGHKLLMMHGLAPIINGMGLIITIFSYDGQMTVSCTSDQNSMPDIEVFARYIRESANELEEAVAQRSEAKAKEVEAEAATHASLPADELLKHFKKGMKKHRSSFPEKGGLVEIHLLHSDTFWRVDLNSGLNIRKSKAAGPDVNFSMEDEYLTKIFQGQLGWQTAVIQGRITVMGDQAIAAGFGKGMDAMGQLIVEK